MCNKRFWVLLILIIFVAVANAIVYKNLIKAIKLNSIGACILADTTYPPTEALEVVKGD